MNANVYDDRSNRRLVSIVRVLLFCALVSIPLPIAGLWAEDPTFTISWVTMAGLTLLSGTYATVLSLAGQGRWHAARRVVFTAWSTYGASVILLYDIDLAPLTQAILLTIGTLFMVVVQNATLALAPWQEARWWVAGSFLCNLSAFGFITWRNGIDLQLMVSLLIVSTVLGAASAWPSRMLTHDLEESLDESEERRLEALDNRQEAADARDQALAANTAKSRFLANMSHELRTPLNAIIGYVELIQDEAADQDLHGFDEDLGRIQSAGTHLLGLINAILDLSKIEAGKMEVVNAPIDASLMMHELASTIRPLARGKALELRVDVADDLPRFRTDAQKLRQVLLNLLANAVNFTDAGSIELHAQLAGEGVAFQVVDSGVGITPARLTKVFDAFERTEAEVTTRVGGTGLGLAISQRICELLGGALSAESQVGRGSTFTAWIPLTPPLRRRTSHDTK